jgi:DNA-binding SARP family transcriptional activator
MFLGEGHEMEVQILGPLRVLREGAELDLGTWKQRVLLAVLVGAGGETVSVDRLVDEVWREDPPPRAIASLQVYVSNLRRVLEPERAPRAAAQVLVTRPPGYALVLGPGRLDAACFATEAQEVHRHLNDGEFERAYDLAGESLQRWRGDVLADLTDEPVAQRERPRWTELRLALVENRLHAAVELGLQATAIADLEAFVTANPLRERALGLLLRALYLAGRPVEALERYREHRALLARELGLDPGPDLQDLEAAILRQDPVLLPAVVTSGGRRTAAPMRPAVAPPMGARPAMETAADAAPSGLVGRDAELAVASQIVADVRAGRSRWLTVSGEPGIGKTRLAEAVESQARASGLEVAWGRCHEDDDAPAYWPWTQLLRALSPGEGDPIAGLLQGQDRDPSVVDAGARRYRLHEQVAGLLTNGTRPRLVVIDDVQWADSASLQVLEFLAVEVRDAPLGIVLTLRDGTGGAAVGRTLNTVGRHPGAARIELGPLRPADLADLSLALTDRPLAPEEALALHARTAGNPFFASELLRLGSRRDEAVDVTIPAVVREVVERRLSPLTEDARAALDVAAVVGLGFDLPTVEAASGMDAGRLFDALDLAVATRILVVADGPGPGLRFAHGLVRDTLLEDLSPLRRQRLHARVAEAIQQRPRADEARHAAALAHHLVAAVAFVGPEAARGAAERAAAGAEQRLAFDEAANWWVTALELAGGHGGSPEDTHRLRVATGRSLLLAGRVAEGRDVLSAAMDEAAARRDAAAGATAGIALGASGGAWYWVDPADTPTGLVRRLEAAADACRGQDHPLLVELLGTLALGVYYSDPIRAAVLAREALTIARRLDDPALLAQGLLAAMAGEWGPGTTDRHLALSEELLQLPAGARPPVLEVACRLWRMTALQERGELAAADEQHAAAAVAAETSGLVVLRAQVAIARVGQAWLGADGLDAVEGAVETATRLHRRSGLYADEAARLANLSFVRLLQGRLGDIADRLPVVAAIGSWREEMLAMAQLGWGDHAGAVALLEQDRSPIPPTWQWFATQVCRAMLVVETGCTHLAPPLRADLGPHVDTVVVTGMSMTALGPVALHLGALDLLVGDTAAAERHLRAGLATCERLGASIWGTLARFHLGRTLLMTGRTADGDRELARAARDAAGLGMDAVATRCSIA